MKGQTPITSSSGSWRNLTLQGVLITTPQGRKTDLLIRSIAGAADAEETIHFLKELKKHLKGRTLLLIWDGLPAHRSKAVTAWIEANSSWLKIVRLPAYAPELNPIEYLWGALKAKHLGNLSDLGAIGKAVHGAKHTIKDTKLLRGFLRASGLY